ncbi:MAG: AMP-binding protein, partial [bacterium]
MNLVNLALESIEKFGEMVSLVYEGKEYTNVQIHEEGDRLAAGLSKLGLSKGDKIIVCAPNCPEILTSYGAILKMGCTIIPVLFLLQAEEIRYIMENSEARATITSEELVDKIRSAAGQVPSMRHIVVIGEKEIEGTVPYKKLVEENEPGFGVVDVDRDAL